MKAVHEMETKAPDLAVTPGILYSQPPQVLFWALGSLHHLMVQKSCLAVALLFPHPNSPPALQISAENVAQSLPSPGIPY